MKTLKNPSITRTRSVIVVDDWVNAGASLWGFNQRLAGVDYTDPQLLAALSHDVSGLFAAGAQVYGGTMLGQCLGDASRAWGRGGQTYHGRGYRTPSALGHAARVLTSRNVNELVLAIDILLILLDLARQIARLTRNKNRFIRLATY